MRKEFSKRFLGGREMLPNSWGRIPGAILYNILTGNSVNIKSNPYVHQSRVLTSLEDCDNLSDISPRHYGDTSKTNPGGATGAILASSAAGKKSSPSFVELRKILKNLTLALIDFLQFSKLLINVGAI